MIVNANLAWAGTLNFKGLIVVLGDSFVNGGGHGGDHGGSVVMVNALGAESAIRLAPQLGQNPRCLQLKATNFSSRRRLEPE